MPNTKCIKDEDHNDEGHRVPVLSSILVWSDDQQSPPDQLPCATHHAEGFINSSSSRTSTATLQARYYYPSQVTDGETDLERSEYLAQDLKARE